MRNDIFRITTFRVKILARIANTNIIWERFLFPLDEHLCDPVLKFLRGWSPKGWTCCSPAHAGNKLWSGQALLMVTRPELWGDKLCRLSLGLLNQHTRMHTLAPSFTSSVTWGKLLPLCEHCRSAVSKVTGQGVIGTGEMWSTLDRKGGMRAQSPGGWVVLKKQI